MAAATVGAIGLEPLLGSKYSVASAADDDDRSGGSGRAEEAAKIRIEAAKAERRVPSPPHATNGDEERYADLDQLTRQIRVDVAQARDYFATAK